MRVVVCGQKTTGLPRYFDFLMAAFLGLGVVAFWNVLTDLSEGRPAPFWIPGDTRTSCTMTLPSVMRWGLFLCAGRVYAAWMSGAM